MNVNGDVMAVQKRMRMPIDGCGSAIAMGLMVAGTTLTHPNTPHAIASAIHHAMIGDVINIYV